MPIFLTPQNIVESLRPRRIPEDVLQALASALTWAEANKWKSIKAASAAGYFRELDRAGLFGEQASTSYTYAVKLNILYALSNLQGWRGKEAQQVKTTLKKYTQGV